MTRIEPETGFTLFEIMLAVAIIGLLAMVMIPSFNSHEDEQKLTMASTELVDGLRFARNEAMRTGSAFRVEIDNDNDRFVVTDLSGSAGQTVYHPVNKKPYGIDFATSMIYSGVDINGSSKIDIDFTARGLTDADRVITLSYGSFSTQIMVESTSGRITSL